MEEPMENSYHKLAKICLFLVYLVIVAGAVVRMTGSGMGCPDWPKCFGYYIPPTSQTDLEWQPGREYREGQVIIWNEALLVATTTFTTTTTYIPDHWRPYERHDYALFNAFHTWTEFVNRLLGALAGLATLVLALYSVTYRKKRPSITLLSWLVVLGMGFQAWLGATVVYSVLEPVRITLHMLMALAIVALILYLIHTTGIKQQPPRFEKTILPLLIVALFLTVVQVALGTQVRQFVDEQTDILGYQAKGDWLEGVDWQFYVHRTFSILILLLNGYLAYRTRNTDFGLTRMSWAFAIVVFEVITGGVMYYLNFPFGSQPIHLVLAALLFGLQFYLVLEAISASGQRISS